MPEDCTVACRAVVCVQIAGHDGFGDLFEHRAAVHTPISGGCFLNAHDHGVFRSVGGKIAGKAHQIVGGKPVFTPDLCSAGLTGYAEIFGIGQFTRPAIFADHPFKTGLDVAQRLVLAHFLAQHHDREFFYHLIIASDFGDKARLHQFTAVGHAVVEGQCGDRRHLRFVSDAHPREGRAVPPAGIVALVTNARHAIAGNGNM